MRIIVAENAGSCFGVKRAIEMALEEAARGGNVCTLGPLIHNPQEIERLRSKGIEPVEDIDQLQGGTVIIRSHGASPAELEQLARRDVRVVDATCPLVRRAQDRARDLAEADYAVYVVGEPNHPEVRAILGHAPGAKVLENIESAGGAAGSPRIGIVAQTTQSMETFERVVGIFAKKKFDELRVFNTICSASVERQRAVLDLARQVDVMFILGGFNSANTTRLAEISRETGVETHHIETAAALDQGWVAGVERVGIAAGASTPQWIIDGLVSALEEKGKTRSAAGPPG